jgi:1-acyl-sn-glycerol-3-phosphate acyltransferase
LTDTTPGIEYECTCRQGIFLYLFLDKNPRAKAYLFCKSIWFLNFVWRIHVKKLLWLLYQPYKWLIFFPLVGLSTLILGTLAAISVIFFGPKIASIMGGVSWAKFVAFITPMFVKVYGRENVDKKQSYVVVSNHESQFDILMIYGWLGIDFKWVMKKELRKVPALGIACEKLEHIYIDRSNHLASLASLESAKKRIVNGTSVMFFPEGTRTSDGSLGVFKKGAFRMAMDLGIPILPVTIVGTRKILPTKTINVFPGKAKMIIHKPVDITGYGESNIKQLIEKTKEVIMSGFNLS